MSASRGTTRDTDRFEFGANWARLQVDETRVSEAERSLCQMLQVRDLNGKTFLDAGSGSGLFSLAARRLGANVVSFDIDPDSVSCTESLRSDSAEHGGKWIVHHGSLLDRDFLTTLGTFDVVYSWGVVHHTGSMWQAMDNLTILVREEGRLFVAIYNDQGWQSRVWRGVKKMYVRSPRFVRTALVLLAAIPLWGPKLVKDLIRRKPLKTWREYAANRGMSPWVDLIDWVGGYPFEVASPEAVIGFYEKRGFSAEKISTVGPRLGCNEFVFRRA